ncbi:hypothetical protein U1Q18_038641, partial [Sarracenia purpurea var. burkii]
WSLIAGRLPGRTTNDAKNYWNTHLQKKVTFERQELAKDDAQKTLESKVIRPQAHTISKCRPWQTSETVTIADGVQTIDKGGIAANSSPTSAIGDGGASWWERIVTNMGEMDTESAWSSVCGLAEVPVIGWQDENIEPPKWAVGDSSIQEKDEQLE